MSRLPRATISMSAALVFQTWPLANDRRLLIPVFIHPLDDESLILFNLAAKQEF